MGDRYDIEGALHRLRVAANTLEGNDYPDQARAIRWIANSLEAEERYRRQVASHD